MASQGEQPNEPSAPTPILTLKRTYIRPYHLPDAPKVPPLANNHEIAKNMRDRFPSPYTLADSENWIKLCLSPEMRDLHYGIFLHDGTFIGGMGLMRRADIEARTVEIGYWIGQEVSLNNNNFFIQYSDTDTD